MVYVGMVSCDNNAKLCDKLPGESSGIFYIQEASSSDSVAAILKSAVVSYL